MELKFDYGYFSESPAYDKYDFDVRIDTITSFYKGGSEPPTIEIWIGENNSDKFLRKRNNADPKIFVHQKLTYMYSPIGKIKDKII